MTRSPVAALVRGWVALYTRGLPGPVRDARRNQVEDDVWCEHEEAAELGRSGRSLGADLLLRLLFGIAADISWRLTYRGQAAPGNVERVSSIGARAVGASAIVGLLSFGFLGVLASTLGPDMGTTGGSSAHIGMVVGAIGVGCLAFLVTAVGLAMLYQDRVGPLGGFGAIVMVLGALTTFGAGFATPLFVGSAMLMWDLARIRVVSRLVPIVHVAYVFFFIFGVMIGGIGFLQGDLGRGLSAVLFTSYVVTWGAIGVSLIRGVPKVQTPSA